MSTVRRRTLVRAAAVAACAGSLLALPTAAALAEGVPAASSAHSAGRPASWVGGRGDAPAQGEGYGYKTGTRSGQVVPVTAAREAEPAAVGSVDARRLSTLADGPGEGVLLLAAGGGIAAVGAAGLGFAMLRRGRTDG